MPNQGKSPVKITQQLIDDVKAFRKHHTQRETATRFGIGLGTVTNICAGKVKPIDEYIPSHAPSKNREIEQEYSKGHGSLTIRSLDVKTLDDALRIGNVDLQIWEVERYVVNSWETTMGARTAGGDFPQTYTNWQVKVWLQRKTLEITSLEKLLDDIKTHGPIVPAKQKPTKAQKHERELEICLFDPHLGLHCFPPGADKPWDLDLCENMFLEVLRDLIEMAKIYGPFSKVVLPIGNDFLHSDNIANTTTAGTPQPESDAWQHVYVRGEKLAIQEIEICKEVAPVEVLAIPGNHDRQSIFTLGRLLAAYYHNDKNVIVDCSSSPYKFHHFGVNLIGFEHGHSIKQTVRLAALMANENRESWAVTSFREWHLGDQHRKGSANPVMMEEQGVSVEFIAGLTPPEEWHRLKSFNWQKRAGTCYVWDKVAGPVARLQRHINAYTGNILR